MSNGQEYQTHGLTLQLHPSVFHPGLFFSTNILVDFVLSKDIIGKDVLELGAGSGLISLKLAEKGAHSYASDINPEAIESINKSAIHNNLRVTTIHSNLFDNIKKDDFDFILINPPYFPKTPKNDREKAFYCGANFEYFHKLFAQLPLYMLVNNSIFMILTDDCDLQQINKIASSQNLKMEVVQEKKKWGEKNLIFKISKT